MRRNEHLLTGTFNRRTVAVIQKHILKRGKRTIVRKLFRPKNNKKLVAAWKFDLDEILGVFEVRLFSSVG